jgi:hypothetical protein
MKTDHSLGNLLHHCAPLVVAILGQDADTSIEDFLDAGQAARSLAGSCNTHVATHKR